MHPAGSFFNPLYIQLLTIPYLRDKTISSNKFSFVLPPKGIFIRFRNSNN